MSARTPPRARECLECHRPDAMQLQNNGVFTAYYVCIYCGCALTIPPATLMIPRKVFGMDH